MGWRERYLQASFRGVEFYVGRARSDFGRRTVTHEFPEQDVPYSEDLGRRAKRWSVDGYLIGEEYLSQRDSLLSACEDQSSAGELIHPYFGAQQVNCLSVQTSDDVTESNMVRVTMLFIESGSKKFPNTSISRSFQNAQNKLSAIKAAKASLLEQYDITRIPTNKVNETREVIADALSLLEDTRLTVKSVASYLKVFKRAEENIEALLNNADDLGGAFVDISSFGTFPSGLYPIDQSDEFDENNIDNPATADNGNVQFSEFRNMWDFSPATSTDTAEAVRQFMIQMSTIMAAGLVSVIDYDNLDEAEELRNVVVDQINTLLDQELNVDLAAALQDLRTSAITAIDERGINLSRLRKLTLTESTPALVLSYRLYGTISQEQDIINRNKVENPGFVPGGKPIEVLIDV